MNNKQKAFWDWFTSTNLPTYTGIAVSVLMLLLLWAYRFGAAWFPRGGA